MKDEDIKEKEEVVKCNLGRKKGFLLGYERI